MDSNRASAQHSRREKQFVRDRDRMANYNARKTGGTSVDTRRNEDTWADDTRYDTARYEDPPARTSSGRGRRQFRGSKPNPRSVTQERSSNQNPLTKYRSTTETPPSDELRYDVASLGVMTPQQDKFVFNHTADGFLNVVEQCYNKLVAIDGRTPRRLPFPVFLHNMNQLYYVHMYTIAENTGQQATWTSRVPCDDMQRLISADTVEIPEEIWFWLKGLGQWIDRKGIKWIPNFPEQWSPKSSRNIQRVPVTGGDFGVPTEQNHNAYENHISPCATRAFVTAALNDNHNNNGIVEYQPLPIPLQPPGLIPNANFLGYYPSSRRLHAECLQFYDQFNNFWANGIGTRIGYNPYLWTKMTAALQPIKGKMKFRTGMPTTTAGSQALYGSLLYAGENQVIRIENGTIESSAEMDPQSLSTTLVNAYRRHRHRLSPGVCYETLLHVVPEEWAETMNQEYEMEEPFAPTIGLPNLSLNEINFTREITEGRYNIILDEIMRLTLIERR